MIGFRYFFCDSLGQKIVGNLLDIASNILHNGTGIYTRNF